MQQQVAAPDPLIGQTIGNYEVKSKLGEGGMGAVYLAEHPLIGKKVALKVLHSEFSGNDDIATRFFHEAKAVNDIQHPNIVDILDYGVIPNQDRKTVYFIMEFLDGQSLAHLVRAQAPLPAERALAIALQIADALAASHKQDIVHRDLKPDNVMLIPRGRVPDFVKVLDFGIAKLTGDQHPGSRRTRTGIVMGTPAYMSPEQCQGTGNVDHRTDIYALGILLYEMLTGRVPFLGEGFGEVLVQHITMPPTRLSMITPIQPHVEAMVLKALEKQPEARYPNMDEFMKALADPVGYVESHGGLAGFLSAHLSPTGSGPYTPLSPVPGQLMTPPPGQLTPMSMYTPAPGTLAIPGMGTLPPGQAEESQGGRALHLAIIAFAATVVIALGIGGYFMLAKSDEGAVADTGTNIDNRAGTTPDSADQAGDRTGTDGHDGQGVQPDHAGEQGKQGVAGAGADTGQGTDEGQAAKEPEMVTVMVATEPDGAEVYLNDEEKPRGTTPLRFEIEKSARKMTLSIRRDKFKTETRTFTADKNADFELNLSRGKRPIKRTRPDGKGIDKDVGLMSPDWD
jgi:eukaryotic-like serine/threonine-protein kinase